MLTRLDPVTTRSPQMLDRLEKLIMERVRKECPRVEWVSSFATLGPFDYVDVFHAHDTDEAIRVSVLFRAYGHTHTEVWPATEWPHFKELVKGLARS